MPGGIISQALRHVPQAALDAGIHLATGPLEGEVHTGDGLGPTIHVTRHAHMWHVDCEPVHWAGASRSEAARQTALAITLATAGRLPS